MIKKLTGLLAVVLLVINTCDGRSSPIDPVASYDHEIELAPNVADLWWTVGDNETNILFELHIKTTGWIALGISPGTVITIGSLCQYEILRIFYI